MIHLLVFLYFVFNKNTVKSSFFFVQLIIIKYYAKIIDPYLYIIFIGLFPFLIKENKGKSLIFIFIIHEGVFTLFFGKK